MRSCNSSVTVSILLTVLLKAKSPLVLANDSKRLRANTISLTKFMSLSNSSTLTFTGAANSFELSASFTAASIEASLTTSKISCSRSCAAFSRIASANAACVSSFTASTAGLADAVVGISGAANGAADGAEVVFATPTPPSVRNFKF